MPSSPALTVWTIGHSTRSWDEFLALLQAHRIAAIADVRRFPASRKHPQFGADALAGIAGSSYVRGIMSAGGRGELVTGETITPNYFELLGIPIPLGRTFRADENVTPDASPVIIVSHGLWQRSLGGAAGERESHGQRGKSLLGHGEPFGDCGADRFGVWGPR